MKFNNIDELVNVLKKDRNALDGLTKKDVVAAYNLMYKTPLKKSDNKERVLMHIKHYIDSLIRANAMK